MHPRGIRLLAAIFAIGLARAGAAEDVSQGGALLNAPLSIRQLGMGNTSIGGDDVMRAWSNPALLAARENGGELALNGGSYFMGTSALGVGAGKTVSPRWSLGALFSLNGFSAPEIGYDGYETGGEITRTSAALAAMGAYRHKWFPRRPRHQGLSGQYWRRLGKGRGRRHRSGGRFEKREHRDFRPQLERRYAQ